MRVTIIRDTDRVVINGEPYTVDCKDLPADFHALQWVETHGEIEYSMTVCTHCNTRSKKPNEPISDLSPYQKYIDAWGVAKEAARLAAAKAQAEAVADMERAKEAGEKAMADAAARAVQEHMANAARSQG